jgi:predicted Zn finger-like uncharacterized protein
MDVRCEKCQTEYELDEARLKPGGVTVKCTHCGHMFKIRKRTTTAVGVDVRSDGMRSDGMRGDGMRSDGKVAPEAALKPVSATASNALASLDEAVTTTAERQWLVRLANGEQKSCRELATLQQWIISGVATRESMISRSGKTWKRLGDITELAQYFDVADEARTTRDERRAPTKPPTGTQLGFSGGSTGGSGPTAAGGTILPDDDVSTGNYGAVARRPPTKPPPLPPKATTPPHGAKATTPQPVPLATTATASGPVRRPLTTPPPPPPKKPEGPSDGRATATWATAGGDKVGAPNDRTSAPFVGKLAAIPDEPAFAGPRPGGARLDADRDDGDVYRDDDLIPPRRGSRAGLVIALLVLIVGAGVAAVVYTFFLREPAKLAVVDAGTTVAQTPDAATPIVTPVPTIDAAETSSALDDVRGELATDNEARIKTAFEALATTDRVDGFALRAHLAVALAQGMLDRATLVADKAEADTLRKGARELVLTAATAAQKAHKASAGDAAAELAMAQVLRLQNKPAREVQRYLDAAKAKPGPWARDVALGEAMLLHREGKLSDAKTALATIDSGDGKLETSNDVRARFRLALIAQIEDRASEARTMADQILAAQPEHAGARALVTKLEARVASGDPLPPEDPGRGSGSAKPAGPGSGGVGPEPIAGDYDVLLRKATTLARDGNCTRAIDVFTKALEKKPNGVEALTGLGYCHLDAKNFASAQSRFRTALALSARFEPALAGIAEAYQQQGRKDDAIAAWRRYLDAYPGARKGVAALERLGVSADNNANPGGGSGSGSSGPGPGSGSGEATPPPPPPPPSTPGSGSN